MTARFRVLATLVVVAIAISSFAFAGALLAATGHPSSAPLSTATAPIHKAAVRSPAASTQSPVAPGASAEARLMAKIKASHADLEKIYPPNLVYAPTVQNGVITKPGYPQAPEPAGLADYGVINSTGIPKSITIDTTSYRAGVTINSVDPYYLTTGVPEGFTSQLNVVLQNVTLFGNSSDNFWTQNVFFYDAYSDQMFIENNIWNFSAYPTGQLDNVFLTNVTGYTNGTNNPYIGYYAAGTPTYDGITTPFTVEFYINATTYDSTWGTEYTEVDFSFNLSYAGGAHYINWMYDRVLFNNTGTGPIPQAHFHVDGTNFTPLYWIPYDAEVMLGGPGGGSTATFYGLNATMTLQHWNALTDQYVNEPSAWSSGTETGETAVGVAEYYTADDTAHLGAGPEFIQPFWNSSATATPGAARLSGTISPSNAWAFVTNGAAYNISNSAWGPLPVSGAYSWNLTQGTYTVKMMESDYNLSISNPLILSSGKTTPYSKTLSANVSMGVYTPLYAMANSQLAAISSGGTGTEADPYMLEDNVVTNLSGEFAAVNDYQFPAYPGISLVGTTAYVEISPVPMQVDFWSVSLVWAERYGTPVTNDLEIWLFATSHVSIVYGQIGGWTGPEQTGFPYADLVLWNTTSTLVFANTFEVTDDGIFTYGGTGNAIVQNLFEYAPVPNATMTPVGYIYPTYPHGIGLYPTALIENEAGDTIFNNYFDTPFTAFETNYNVYDDQYPSVPYAFTNNWNLSTPVREGTSISLPNGFSTAWDMGNYPYMCGNWWYDYLPGNTSLPYDENVGIPLITTGGDYCPTTSLGYVIFSESGLPSGSSWSVTIHGTVLRGTTASLQAVLANGTYAYSVGSVAGYTASPASGSTFVAPQGAVTTVSVVFTASSGTLSGTVSPTTATVTVDGAPVTVTSGAFSVSVSAGTHAVVASASGYYTYYNNLTVSGGGTTTVTIVLNPVTPPVGPDGTLSITVTPTSASVWVDGAAVTLSSGTYSAPATPGVHSVEVTDSGYYTYFNNVTVKSSTTSSVTVNLNAVSSSSSSSSTSISSTGWAIIGVLAALAVIFLITTLVYMGRSRRGSGGTSLGGTGSPGQSPPSGGGSS